MRWFTLSLVALALIFSTGGVAIVGHADSSRKGQVPFEDVRLLSMQRAESVKKAILDKYTGRFDPNKFVVDGKGWNEPADVQDPDNHAKNRRVEISVYQAEAE